MSDPERKLPEVERVVFSQREIADRVRRIGREIDEFYPRDEELLILGLLKGAFVFVSDLVRAIRRPRLQVDFWVAELYGRRGEIAGDDVQLLYGPAREIEGRHVLVVEDIVDSGRTLTRVAEDVAKRSPRSLEFCTLLHKRISKLRQEPRWVGFDAPPEWLVGYGLDYQGRYRHLPYIAAIAGGEE